MHLMSKLLTIIENKLMAIPVEDLSHLDFTDVASSDRHLTTRHPGSLLAELLSELRISQTHLAQEIDCSPRRISQIVHGQRPVTADVALRLGRFFGQSPQFWLNLQNRYDLDHALSAVDKTILTNIHPFARSGSVA